MNEGKFFKSENKKDIQNLREGNGEKTTAKFLEEENSLLNKFFHDKAAKLARVFMATTVFALTQGDYSKIAKERKTQQQAEIIEKKLEFGMPGNNNPFGILQAIEVYKKESDGELFIRAALNKIIGGKKEDVNLHASYLEFALEKFSLYKEYNWAEDYLRKIIDELIELGEIFTVFEYSYLFENKPYEQEIIEKMVKVKPFSVMGHLKSSFFGLGAGGEEKNTKEIDSIKKHFINKLKKSEDKAIKKFVEIYEANYFGAIWERIAYLLPELTYNNLTLKEAEKISSDVGRQFLYLNKIKSDKGYLKRYGFENLLTTEREDDLKSFSLEIVEGVNRAHAEPDEIRYYDFEKFDANALYTLIVSGQEELYTSTFNGLFDRLTVGMKKQGLSGDKLLKEVNYDKFRVFVNLCLSFNRLNDFLATMDGYSKEFFFSSVYKEY